MKRFYLMLVLGCLHGCGAGDGSGLDDQGLPPDSGTPTTPDPEPDDGLRPLLVSLQEEVLTPICSQCHFGNQAPLGLQMDTLEHSMAQLIDVPSVSNPAIKRVDPGDADNSFLYLKIIGDARAGQQMPLNMQPLSAEVQTIFRQWIEQGAPVDEQQFSSSAKSVFSAGEAVLQVLFTQDVAVDAVQSQDFHVVAINLDGTHNDLLPEQVSLSWLDPRHLNLHIEDLGPSVVSARIAFNLDNISSVLSQQGQWLDGDNDGYPGGVFQYEIDF